MKLVGISSERDFVDETVRDERHRAGTIHPMKPRWKPAPTDPATKAHDVRGPVRRIDAAFRQLQHLQCRPPSDHGVSAADPEPMRIR
jgi:hypothetical protein